MILFQWRQLTDRRRHREIASCERKLDLEPSMKEAEDEEIEERLEEDLRTPLFLQPPRLATLFSKKFGYSA